MKDLFRKVTLEKASCPKVIDLVVGVYPEMKLDESLAQLPRRDARSMQVLDRS